VRLWALAGLYVGGVIGAGFASGQELVVFFVDYGSKGLIGIFAAAVLLCLGTVLILDFCARYAVTSYAQIFDCLHPRLSRAFDLLYSAFLLIGTSVMLAGIGALASTPPWGLLLRLGTSLLILFALAAGAQGVTVLSGWLAPILVLILSVLASHRLIQYGLALPRGGSFRAFEAAILYGSYNLGFALAVLAAVHKELKTAAHRWKLAIVANSTLAVCMVLLYFALGTLSKSQLKEAFPLVHLVADLGPVAYASYRFMLWGAMFSTAVAHSLALVQRLSQFQGSSWGTKSLFAIGASLGLSYFGFSTLIRIAYPILGLAGLWIMALLIHERRG
jgi:uncharacterized membrane protein YkvI